MVFTPMTGASVRPYVNLTAGRSVEKTTLQGRSEDAMSNDPISTIQELTKHFRGKLSSCELYDSNVCIIRSAPETPWELTLESGEPFIKRLRFVYRMHKIMLLANQIYLSGKIEGSFAPRPFTVNEKEKAGFRSEYAGYFSAIGKQYPIFTEDGSISTAQRNILRRPELISLVEQSNLKNGESLHFSKAEISFYLMQPGRDRVTQIIDEIINLADRAAVSEYKLDLNLLPVQFHPLIPLIEEWAVDDDYDRDDLISNAQKQALLTLIHKVDPYLGSIDSYLGFFREELPQEAAALGRLAECALEARLYLKENG